MQELLQPTPIQREKLKAGDHIFAYRGEHPFHGIYDGEGKVIHFITSHMNPAQCEQCSNQPNHGATILCLRCFLGGVVGVAGADLFLYRYAAPPTTYLARTRGGTCTLSRSDPPEAVIHRANHLLQNADGINSAYVSYFATRPEDFAVYCKTGLVAVGGSARSGYKGAALTAAMAVAASPLRGLLGYSGMALLGVGTHCLTRLAEDIAIRRDVTKDAVIVAVEEMLS